MYFIVHCDIADLEGGGGSVKFNSIKLLKIGLGLTANNNNGRITGSDPRMTCVTKLYFMAQIMFYITTY